MEFHTIKGQALADLHQILFRPNAKQNIFAAKPFVQQRGFKQGKLVKTHSSLYSPLARTFLEEKNVAKSGYVNPPVLKSQRAHSHDNHSQNYCLGQFHERSRKMKDTTMPNRATYGVPSDRNGIPSTLRRQNPRKDLGGFSRKEKLENRTEGVTDSSREGSLKDFRSQQVKEMLRNAQSKRRDPLDDQGGPRNRGGEYSIDQMITNSRDLEAPAKSTEAIKIGKMEKAFLPNTGSRQNPSGERELVDRESPRNEDCPPSTTPRPERSFQCGKVLKENELSKELIRIIWGPTPKKSPEEEEEQQARAEQLIRQMRKRKEEAANKVAECLMDVLLRNWIYFEHSHEPLKAINNHVHAKYCEGAFGHYLLADGTQIHGSYVISLRQLITELKSLMAKLESRKTKKSYKEVPMWRPPHLEKAVEFHAPEQEPMPQLYPITGLLPTPQDDIPPDLPLPVLRTPERRPHPTYEPPMLASRAGGAAICIPTLEDFSTEERRLRVEEARRDVPAPVFSPPELLPLPIWQEPPKAPPPRTPPVEEAQTLPRLELEVIPPYQTPKLEPRPCEASYYDGDGLVCDGACGRMLTHGTGSPTPCLARRPRLLPTPAAPTAGVIPCPRFEPPTPEPLPRFDPPPIKPEPRFVEPLQAAIPEWIPPPSPDPVGYLVGQRPVFLVDCSATMADYMICAQDVMRHLFAPGGQVEVAATHFDIVMYSFDAWSYGTMVEEKQYKLMGGAPRYWTKNLEVMQPKTPENMAKALAWMQRWQTGGNSNLNNAIEVAMQRGGSADCIYLLTHGKCDRPVILMNILKEMRKEGRVIPICPVGLEPTRPQARILKSVLADMTGGQYRELDRRWQYNLFAGDRDLPEDVRQTIADVEYWQRRNTEAGVHESVDAILRRLKERFDVERRGPRLALAEREKERAEAQHRLLVDAVREENDRALAEARATYERTHAIILERNARMVESAQREWEAEVERIRAANVKNNSLYADWQAEANRIQEANRRSEADARRRFAADVKHIEERYAEAMAHGREEHDALVKHLREKNERMEKAYRKKQEGLIAQAKARNDAGWKAYEDECAEVEASNAQNLETARAEHAAACEAVVAQNRRRLEEAEDDHRRKVEMVASENVRRKAEHAARVLDLEARKAAAQKSHHQRVSTMVAEHKASITEVTVANRNLELAAKRAWEDSCAAVDEENRIMAETTYREWREASLAVQGENERLRGRRAELQLRIEEVERMNADIVRKKKADWKQACHVIEEKYEIATSTARIEYAQYLKELEARNVELLEAAKESHTARVAAVKLYNATMRPYVEEAQSLQKEINKIQAFLGYIVSQSHLPPEKDKKRTLEQSLNALAALDCPCPPKVIIAALKAAYAKEIEAKFLAHKMKGGADTSELDDTASIWRSKQHGRFSNMVPISPERVRGHFCAEGSRAVGDEYRPFVPLKKRMRNLSVSSTATPQRRENATAVAAPPSVEQLRAKG